MSYEADPTRQDRDVRDRYSGASWSLFAVLFLLSFLWIQFTALSSSSAQSPADGEKRIALVIGNNAYQNAPPLANATNDARRIGQTLRQLKFEVEELMDADGRTLGRALRDFGVRAQKADVALLFYAGHGVQVERENYLVPVDARLERERDLLYESIPLDLFLGETSQARKIGIVILDACRNNPFTDRMARSMQVAGRAVSVGKGLARVDRVPRNTVVAMSTKADQIAEDGSGENSPFTEAMLAELQRPGIELSLFFRSVRDAVLKATYNRQEPYIFSSIGAEPFFFNPRPPNRPPEIAALVPFTVPDVAGPTQIRIVLPIDPDGDPLNIRIIGLPRSGEVRIAGNKVAPNEVVPLDRFATATYKPDARSIGQAGTLDFLVEDGHGGSTMASLPILVVPSNRPPAVERERLVRIYPGALAIAPPTDPDGDTLSVVVTGLPPRGVVRRGAAAVKVGEKLRARDLAELTYTPEPGAVGQAGALSYTADDGRGGISEGRVRIEIARVEDSGLLVSEAALWEAVREKGDADDISAFVRVFPQSRLLDDWRSAEKQTASAAPGTPPAMGAQVTQPAERAEAPPSVPRVEAVRPPEPRNQAPAAAAIPPRAEAPPVSAPSEPAANTPSRVAAAPSQPAPVAAAPSAPRQVEPDRSSEPPRPADARAAQAGAGGLPSGLESARPPSRDKEVVDCPECPALLLIPAGSFTMGDAAEASAAPPHRVSIRAFAMARHPVTVAQWKQCVAEKGCASMPRMFEAQDRTPVHNVSWDDAQAYVAWLSRKTGKKYRLPSEAEWEYAARANSSTRYWWGNDAGAALANCADCGGNQNPRTPLEVDAYKPNPFGLQDIHGGVAEWVQDCWLPNYQGAPGDGSAREQKNCRAYVLRGGSFRSKKAAISTTSRNSYDGSVRYLENGFRVARNVD